MKRFLILLAAALVALPLALLALAWIFQRSFLYYPVKGEAPPPPGVQRVELRTADGERLVAWRMPPQPGRPIFLYFGGNAEGLRPDSPRIEELRRAGAGMLAIGYRGYSGSTGSPTEAGLHEDARTAYAFLRRSYPADRIVINGFSLGSGVAVRLAAEHPARALILEAPFLSAADIGGRQLPFLPVDQLMRDRFASGDWIGRVEAPVLIVHGDLDRAISIESGEALFARARQPKRFVRMAGSDHNTLIADGLYDHVWRFLEDTAPPVQRGG